MNYIEELYNLAGSLICHQLPSRTLYAGSAALPVCARDTGIYAGIFTSAVFLLLLGRLKAQKPPGAAITVIMCIMMLPMILDGLLSYTGVIETDNTARLFTGVLFGLPIPIFLVPAAHFNIDGRNDRPVLKNAAELAPVYAAGLVLCLLLLKGVVPYVAAGFIFVSGFLFLMFRISYTVFARATRFRNGKLLAAAGGSTLLALALLYLLSAFVLQPLKQVLLGG